ncbi:MAG: hypothetical protein HY831_02865 [Candidatus Aenigmarchaeota archaeon]|nr:hypothetical protein [Candidatus Aenigmarchaeota archaeon]
MEYTVTMRKIIEESGPVYVADFSRSVKSGDKLITQLTAQTPEDLMKELYKTGSSNDRVDYIYTEGKEALTLEEKTRMNDSWPKAA